MLAIPAIASAKLTWKQALLVQINTYRVHNHRASLHFNTRLGDRRAGAQQQHGPLPPVQPHVVERRRLGPRIRYYGYRGRYLGENLAVGQFTPAGTFHAWYYSSAAPRQPADAGRTGASASA